MEYLEIIILELMVVKVLGIKKTWRYLVNLLFYPIVKK